MIFLPGFPLTVCSAHPLSLSLLRFANLRVFLGCSLPLITTPSTTSDPKYLFFPFPQFFSFHLSTPSLSSVLNNQAYVSCSFRSFIEASEVCANNPPGVPRSTLQKKVILPLEKQLTHPAIAAGVLLWIEHSLCANPKPMELKVNTSLTD